MAIGYPTVRKLDSDLWEVRSDISDKRICRLMFTIVYERMILLHSFMKNPQKTPKEDMELSKKKKKSSFRRTKMNNAYIGSSFDDFLEEEGIATEEKNEAIKRLLAYNLIEEMQKQNINKNRNGKKNVDFQSVFRQTFKSI